MALHRRVTLSAKGAKMCTQAPAPGYINVIRVIIGPRNKPSTTVSCYDSVHGVQKCGIPAL